MPFREKVGIKEKLIVHIKNTETGEVKSYTAYPTWKHKILKLFGKHYSVTVEGLGVAAKRFGGVTVDPVTQMSAYRSGVGWETYVNATVTFGGTDTLSLKNDTNPWTTAGVYWAVACKGATTNICQQVGETDGSGNFNVEITASHEWYAEVIFTFS
jgi:hypothetical protein